MRPCSRTGAADPLTATSDDQVAGGHPTTDRRSWVNGRWRDYISLAGSETSTSEPGYLAGAVEAGKRAVAGGFKRSSQHPCMNGFEEQVQSLGRGFPVKRLSGPSVESERSVQGSITGTPYENEKALNFGVLSDVRPQIETMPLERALAAYEKMKSGNIKFRMVLTMKGPYHAH